MPDIFDRLKTALADRYTIEHEIGSGGMATVYLAEDLKHHRKVAVKVLRPELAAVLGPERFLREIETTANLNHPHILPLFDSGEADGFLYYVMPFVDGVSLRKKIDQEKQLDIDESLEIAKTVAGALGYAHEQGVIHRDIKPENILLHKGEVLVADFGIALAVQAAGATRLTDTGFSPGTPHYMSPEQAGGEANPDGRSDLYSLACVLYEMLVGEPPFTGPNVQAILARQMNETPPSLRVVRASVPEEIERAVQKALAKIPADRLASAIEFQKSLSQSGIGGPKPRMVTSKTAVFSIAAAAATGRRGAWAALAVALAVSLVLILIPRGSEPADAAVHRIAVAPFDVVGGTPELEIWREGIVDLVSRSLDHAGGIRAVAPSVSIRRWRGRADQPSAIEFGRSIEADRVVYGTLFAAGPDSARLSAVVVDVLLGTVQQELEYRESVDRVDRLADSLAIDILRGTPWFGRDQPVHRRPFGSSSVPAIKAFLQGEQFYRLMRLDSASLYYRRAVNTDPTFAPALARLCYTELGMSLYTIPQAALDLCLRAGANNRGLPHRDSLSIVLDSLMAASVLERWFAPGQYARVMRLFELAEQLAEDYPGDSEVWLNIAEIRQYLSGPLGVDRESALLAFERALDLDSTFAPNYGNVAFLALRLRGRAEAMSYLRGFASINQDESVVRFVDEFEAFTGTRQGLRSFLDTASSGTLWMFVAAPVEFFPSMLGEWADSGETAVHLAREIELRGLNTMRRLEPGSALAFRGHWREAHQMFDQIYATPHMLTSLITALGVDSSFAQPRSGEQPWYADSAIDRARAYFADRLASSNGRAYLGLPFWSAMRDTVSIRRLLVQIGDLSVTGAWGGATFGAHGRPVGEAYLALARGDTALALERFLDGLGYADGRVTRRTVTPEGVCPVRFCPFERLELERLLMERGRYEEAALLLDWVVPQLTVSFPFLKALGALERGRAHDRLGHNLAAIESYSFVVDAWMNADAELQPFVTEARRALARLNAEPRRD